MNLSSLNKPRALLYGSSALSIVTGVGVRLLFSREPLWGDELYSFFQFARFPIPIIVTTYFNTNNHIFHSILTHILFRIAGFSELSLRLPALLSGILVVLLTYRLAKSVTGDKRVAALATAYTSLSHTMIFFSSYARGYMLQCGLVCVLALACLPSTGFQFYAAAILPFLVLYTIPSGLIFVIPFFGYWLYFVITSQPKDRRYVSLSLGLTIFLSTLAFLPLWKYFGALAIYNFDATTNANFFMEVLRQAAEGIMPPWCLGLGLLVGSAFSIKRSSNESFLLILVWTYPIVAFLGSHLWPQLRFFPRSYAINLPFVFIIAAIGFWKLIDLIKARHSAIGTFAGWALGPTSLAIMSLYLYPVLLNHGRLQTPLGYLGQHDPHGAAADYRRLTRKIAARLKPRSILQGTDSLSDETVAAYTVEQRGFAGFYGLGNLSRRPIDTIFLFGPDEANVQSFYHHYLSSGWSSPKRAECSPLVYVATTERTHKKPLMTNRRLTLNHVLSNVKSGP